MLRSSLPLVFLATSAVAFVACGSDTTSTTSTGSGGATSASSTGGGTSGTGGSASTSTTATGTATSTGTAMAVMNACTNAADTAIIGMKDVKAITTTCGQQNVGGEPATLNCIVMQTGLSGDCAGCYSGEVDCVSVHCLGAEGKCLTAPADQLCTDCRNMYCVPAYEACSGNKSM
jgi:hypothetical protein